MSTSLRVVESVSHDPWFNLALEEWLFESTREDELIFYLWRNGPTVVIGRHQNPWVECRLDDMERDGVRLARRASGGGAVFHDLGNTNFTFAARRAHYNVARQIDVVVAALAGVGVEARFSGRNDIVVGETKVSGSAFFGRKDRWLHHGTLLLHADLGRLAHYLTVKPSKIASKGVASVRARVANLDEFVPGIDHAQIGGALVEAVADEYGGGFTVERIDPADMADGELAERVARHADDVWRFGKTPAFSHHLETRFGWGGLDLHLDVVKGVIRAAVVYSDTLAIDLVDDLVAALEGAPYAGDEVADRIRRRAERTGASTEHAGDVAAWLADELGS